MNQRKHNKTVSAKSKKATALLVSVILLLCVTVGGTLAFLMAQADPVHNLFTPSTVTTMVEETREGSRKSDVSIKNTGDTEAYIRATIVVTWQDESGNVYGKLPVEGSSEDYTMVINTEQQSVTETSAAGQWKLAADGFYYWTTPVAPGASTGVLITSCDFNTATRDPEIPTEYSLDVAIIGSGIQSKPGSVVEEEWKSGVSGVATDGALNIKPEQGGTGE